MQRAARCAFWLAFGLLNRGELAPGGGWIARARRLLDDHELDCVEQGYLLMPLALQSIDEGDAANAYATFGQVAKVAERFRDLDLLAMARFGTGMAMLRLGETTAGLAQKRSTRRLSWRAPANCSAWPTAPWRPGRGSDRGRRSPQRLPASGRRARYVEVTDACARNNRRSRARVDSS